MSRTERLLDLLQMLRQRRTPVTGPELAHNLGISIRTLYRDIATLQAQGADIQGEPGFGYVLQPGFMLPPLMFSNDEIEALVLGSRWVAARTADERLGKAAVNALSKIAAVLPPDLREIAEATTFLVAPRRCGASGSRSGLYPGRDPQRAQDRHHLSKGGWLGEPADHLANPNRLFRTCADRRWLVRTAAGLPSFSHRSHHRA